MVTCGSERVNVVNWSFVSHRDKNSGTMEPMEADFYNNNVTNSNSVRKRKATDGQQSDVLVVRLQY